MNRNPAITWEDDEDVETYKAPGNLIGEDFFDEVVNEPVAEADEGTGRILRQA